jgi:PKD repeat protein
MAVAPSNSNYIYAASFDTLFFTTNGGTNWFFSNNLFGITPITYIAVSPTNPQHVYCTIGGYTSGQKVYKSTDAGTTWTNFSGTLPNLPVNCIVYETGSSDRLYIGTDVGVFYREASMNDWLAYNTGLPNVVVTDLEISYQDNKLWAGTFGRGLWSTDLAGTPPPAAAFTANNTLICAGNCVNFTDNSTQSPSSWSWSFPGASTASSTQQNPGNICYPTAGTYNVSLTATNSSGSGSATLTGYIVVGSGPTTPIIQASPAASFCQGASATINVTNPCSGCTFTWTPGGQTGSSITTTTAGNYIVAAADNCGQTASAPLTITIFPTPSTPSISINGNLLFTSVASNYQWYLNGNPIPGATQQTYQPTAAGNYTVEIQDANNCTATSAPVTFTPTSRDASSVNTGSILKVYPNPAQDDLEISMLNLPETKSLIILNILGEKLLDVKISPSNTSTAVFKINTSSIPAGNYLIGIEGEDRQTFQKFSILR